jgi:adenylyltransferase/sulfurtransferase
MFNFGISNRPIDPQALTQAMQDKSAGACVSFEGRVRDHNDGRAVKWLSYEVFHALAVSEGKKILSEAKNKFGIIAAEAIHGEGDLNIHDCAVWVGVLSAHRAEAFEACRYIINQIKYRLPIWKKEFYVDGSAEWVNCQHHDHHHSEIKLSEKDFYLRQTLLPEISTTGQAKLKAARVLVVGSGGLGSSALHVLAASGIGEIGIIEHDQLDISNLHRQTLYSAADIGKPKAELAAARLKALNPFITVTAMTEKATAKNIPELFVYYDLVLDCTDNFKTKYLLNDAAFLYGKPVIQASLYRFEGQLLTIDPKNNAGCLRCLWPEPPQVGLVGDCAEIGVIGSVPALFGTLQANQAIKHILGLGANARDLFTFDILSLTSRRIVRHRRNDCALCGNKPSITKIISDVFEVSARASETRDALLNNYHWIDVREKHERDTMPLPEADHHPLSSFSTNQFAYALDKPLLIICAKGHRSANVTKKLRAAGWKNAFSLSGGIGQLPPAAIARAG